MAGFGGGGAGTTLNGTTWVTVVTAPASGEKQILSAKPRNDDTVQHIYEQRVLKSATPHTHPYDLILPAGGFGELISNCIVLVANDEVYQVRTAEATTTTESVVIPAVFEVP